MADSGWLDPKAASVLHIPDSRHDFGKCKGWKDVLGLMGPHAPLTAAFAATKLPTGEDRSESLSLAFTDYDLAAITTNGALKGLQVRVIAESSTAKTVIIPSLQLTKSKLCPARRWANKGTGDVFLPTNGLTEANALVFPAAANQTDSWKINTFTGTEVKSYAAQFGVILKFAGYDRRKTAVVKVNKVQLKFFW